MRIIMMLIGLLAASFGVCQGNEFISEVNKIRALKGQKALHVSSELQRRTDQHAQVVLENGCDLIRKKGHSITSLKTFSRVVKRCSGGICKLTPYQSQKQTVKDKAWSLAYRSNEIYSFSSTKISLSTATCGEKTVLIVLVT